MSGIVGIFHREGALVDRALLQASVATMTFRGPDENGLWCAGLIGFGHAMLRASVESRAEHQPAALLNRFWITADVRLDSRAELIASLTENGCRMAPSVPDPALLLHAYSVWGVRCVEHLRGDFAFAIWDATEQQLFCARDHFGIRPFYYADLGDLFLFSNTLNTVLFHPQVSDELNDRAVADFLLFGLNCNNSTTTFRDILRLPPAHSLVVSRAGLEHKCYWAPPTNGRIRYKRPSEYVEQFQSLLQEAVADRLRASPSGILLSGGLDSGTVAATAQKISARCGQPTALRSYTFVHELLVNDQEGPLARATADFLSIPNRVLPADASEPFARPADPAWGLPEPLDNPFSSGLAEDYRIIASECRVVFSGEGGDNLMHFQMLPYLRDLQHTGDWQRLAREVPAFLWIRHFPWRGIRYRLQKCFGQDSLIPDFPGWLNPDFVERLQLKERWRAGNQLPIPQIAHPIHPKAHASLSLPQWTRMFETENASATHQPVDVVYPFLDLRLVHFLLALPPFPWFFQKRLLRQAMLGQLPEIIRTRQKTPLEGDPLVQRFQQYGGAWPSLPPWSDQLDRYINRSQFRGLRGTLTSEQVSLDARPHCFNFWLQTRSRVQYK